jgi:hypothetical protein
MQRGGGPKSGGSDWRLSWSPCTRRAQSFYAPNRGSALRALRAVRRARAAAPLRLGGAVALQALARHLFLPFPLPLLPLLFLLLLLHLGGARLRRAAGRARVGGRRARGGRLQRLGDGSREGLALALERLARLVELARALARELARRRDLLVQRGRLAAGRLEVRLRLAEVALDVGEAAAQLQQLLGLGVLALLGRLGSRLRRLERLRAAEGGARVSGCGVALRLADGTAGSGTGKLSAKRARRLVGRTRQLGRLELQLQALVVGHDALHILHAAGSRARALLW